MPTIEKADEIKNAGQWPSSKKCSFIEPGVVMYQDVGMVYVKKEVLDKMMDSFVGKPVVNEEHRDVAPSDFKSGNADGIVNSVWYEPSDGMFHCSYQVWDSKTLSNMNQGYKVSCAYTVKKWGPAGIHNNVPYEKEVLDGEYTHLAIVSNPRYEGVRIYNDKGASKMKLMWWKKGKDAEGKELENSTEIETSSSIVEIEGKEVGLDNLIDAFKEQEDKKKKALENRAPVDTDMIDIGDGKKVSVAELKNAFKAKAAEVEAEAAAKAKKEAEDLALKNQAEKSVEQDHKDEKHKGAPLENCVSCKELKNDQDKAHFERVQALANDRTGDVSDILPAPYDGIEEGKKRFGSVTAQAAK